MKRLVLYVTSDQLRTILPLVINDCVDFSVGDLDHVTEVGPPKEVKPSVEAIESVSPAQPVEEPGPEPKSHPLDELGPHKRKLLRKDHLGRKPWEVVVAAFDEKRKAVLTRIELTKAVTDAGFGEGTVSSALHNAVMQGFVRKLNNHRFTIKNAKGHTLKSLADLDVVKE